MSSIRTASDLRRTLCSWYVEYRRDLPWRRTFDPYAIWISEAMLQQTRVETVLPYYARFMDAFPTVVDLAAADEEDVVALWSGLGYYRRARALHGAAQEIAVENGGRFPRTRDELLALPGVGAYTAGAVLSIAFDLPEPLVDGNVARVFSRLFALDEPPGGALDRRLWALASELVPERRDGDDTVTPRHWNQGLMELGALICTARSPRCNECPLADRCEAHRTQRVAELPRRVERAQPIDVELEVLLVQRGDELLFVRRPAAGRMARMWELPTREVRPAESPPCAATHLWPPEHELAGSIETVEPEPVNTVRHSITKHRIRAHVHRAALREAIDASGSLVVLWLPATELLDRGTSGGPALTGLTRKILERSFVATDSSD